MAGTPQQCKPITVGPIQKYTYSTERITYSTWTGY
jgi:hypothetical protein